MASAGKVDVSVHVKPKVGIGATTIGGSAVTVTAYAVAVVAFAQGARDEETMSALAVGTVSLVTVLAGRYGQAIAALLRSSWGAKPPAAAPPFQVGSSAGTAVSGSGTQFVSTYTTGSRAGGYAKTDPDAADEPGDPDTLPDYETTENPPADEGDQHARPDQEDAP